MNWFLNNRIVKSSAVFDLDKLKWINSQHLRALPLDQVQNLVLDSLRTASLLHSEEEAVKHPNFAEFLVSASKIAQRDMELTIDAPVLISNCLNYAIEETLLSDPHVLEVLQQSDALKTIISTLIADFEAGKLPVGKEDKFGDVWKAYVKQLGGAVGLKGKGLFHPLRLALTGRMSGPDVGDQLRLLWLSEGIVSGGSKIVSLKERMERLRTFDVLEALKAVQEREDEEAKKKMSSDTEPSAVVA